MIEDIKKHGQNSEHIDLTDPQERLDDEWMEEARRIDEKLKSLWLGIKTWLGVKPF